MESEILKKLIKETAIISIEEVESRKNHEISNTPISPPPSLTIYAESVLQELGITINSIEDYPSDSIIENNDCYSTENNMFREFKDVKFGNTNDIYNI